MRSEAFLPMFVVLCASNVPANALSWNTQMNCASDYYAYCSMHPAGSAGCHACMRANRQKLSSSCVSALIDDGVLPKTNAAPRKTKIAAARIAARSVADPIEKAPSANVAAVGPTPTAGSSDANAERSAQSEPAASEPSAMPPQQVVEAAPEIDQQTYEALKNRAPYFVPLEDLASIFSRAEETTSPEPPSTPR